MNKTIYGLDVKTQWEKILELHVLKLARKIYDDTIHNVV